MATTAMVARALGRCRLAVATNMPWCNLVEGAFPRLVSRTRVTVAAAALVAAQALCCSTESSGTSPAGGNGGGGVAGVAGSAENGGSPECYDCSLIGWCEGKSAINPEQDECGCTDTVTFCKDLCVLNGLPRLLHHAVWRRGLPALLLRRHVAVLHRRRDLWRRQHFAIRAALRADCRPGTR